MRSNQYAGPMLKCNLSTCKVVDQKCTNSTLHKPPSEVKIIDITNHNPFNDRSEERKGRDKRVSARK